MDVEVYFFSIYVEPTGSGAQESSQTQAKKWCSSIWSLWWTSAPVSNVRTWCIEVQSNFHRKLFWQPEWCIQLSIYNDSRIPRMHNFTSFFLSYYIKIFSQKQLQDNLYVVWVCKYVNSIYEMRFPIWLKTDFCQYLCVLYY